MEHALDIGVDEIEQGYTSFKMRVTSLSDRFSSVLRIDRERSRGQDGEKRRWFGRSSGSSPALGTSHARSEVTLILNRV
ncbi:hypothetical protein WH47_04910 [Habropoda laboriosa]|uniref:Uncharacterized protein n=1 Tax=Habropoda laboriosa TaxID=597456 RepID=A0A0L7RJC0_9HYME|nr:hypothetical protein WH47_04910 [Habropoda laboriosa]